MDIKVIRDPVFAIIIDNVLNKKTNKAILDEVIKNKNNFKEAWVGNVVGRLNKKLRSNTTAFYDDIYVNNRHSSVLLTAIDRFFSGDDFKTMLGSAPLPIALFNDTNYHETQVSRYGDDGQHYGYHVDSFGNKGRTITCVYYLHSEPKKFKGGQIELTDSIIDSKGPIEPDRKTVKIEPLNNRMVIFDSFTAHRVLSTTSPKRWDSGRFSVNIWVGYSG